MSSEKCSTGPILVEFASFNGMYQGVMAKILSYPSDHDSILMMNLLYFFLFFFIV
jgi:hypothetical protein